MNDLPVPGGPVSRKPLGVERSSSPSASFSTRTSAVLLLASSMAMRDARSAASSGVSPIPKLESGERLNGQAGTVPAAGSEDGRRASNSVSSRTGGW